MITETIIENGLIERKSDKGVFIRNMQTKAEYTVAVDLPNDERVKRGLEPYSYVETEKKIDSFLAAEKGNNSAEW